VYPNICTKHTHFYYCPSFIHSTLIIGAPMLLYFALVGVIIRVQYAEAVTKVLVPASYREWIRGFPDFVTNETLKAEYGYSTFLYQKHNPDLPNYVSSNRGCENSIYYKYIVDHYHDFPDLAIFVHAKPGEHNSDQWLNYIKCIRPNATYMSLNVEKQVCREVFNGYWARYGIWLEHCIREVLRLILYNGENTTPLN
jgi:hypothetical protein